MEFPDTLNALVVARRIASRLDEDGIAYGVGDVARIGLFGPPSAA